MCAISLLFLAAWSFAPIATETLPPAMPIAPQRIRDGTVVLDSLFARFQILPAVAAFLGFVPAIFYFRSSRLSFRIWFWITGLILLVMIGRIVRGWMDENPTTWRAVLLIATVFLIGLFLDVAPLVFGVCLVPAAVSFPIYLSLIAVFSTISPQQDARMAGTPQHAPCVIQPRPELACNTRRWTHLVTPIRLSWISYSFGYLSTLIGSLGGIGVLLLYLRITVGIGTRGHVVVIMLLSSAALLFSSLIHDLKRLPTPTALKNCPALWSAASYVLAYSMAWAGALGLLLLYDLFNPRLLVLDYGLIVALLSCPAYLCLVLLGYGLRFRAIHALKRLKKDQRPPILLLRSFRDDMAVIAGGSFRRPWWAFWAIGVWRSPTFEETLCDLLTPYGPVIAIGRPGEMVSPLGASRFWVSDDKWQQVIEELLRESQLVLMIMGATQGDTGLAWEVRRIFGIRQLPKLVLVMPPVGHEMARQRWESFRSLCQDRLPVFQGGELAAVSTNEGAFVVIRRQDPKRYLWRPNAEDLRALFELAPSHWRPET